MHYTTSLTWPGRFIVAGLVIGAIASALALLAAAVFIVVKVASIAWGCS